MPDTKLPELREDFHGVIPYERTLPPLSLLEPEQQKAELIALREECETDEERAAIDQRIVEYIETDLEKVTGLAALFTYFKSSAAAERADEERIQKDRARWQGRFELLKGFVQQVMQRRKIPAVSNATARFRLQDNPVTVEIVDAKLVPLQFMRVNVTMSWDEWQRMLTLCEVYIKTYPGKAISPIVIEQVTPSVNASILKAALLVKVQCPACANKRPETGANCQTCHGSRLVPATVPGARLSQTQHLRIE